MVQFQSEATMEDLLITQLVSGESQWTYRSDLRTEDALWQNVFQKIEHNNKERLNETLLTAQECEQIKDQLHFSNFYQAAQFWAGENGVSKVSVQREDASLGTVHLEVHNSQHITGGMSSYEVINQCVRFKEHKLDRNRRFDITLLLNGLPIVQIELKNRAHSYMDAFNQIKKYANEQLFTGLFSTLQMFVVSNGVGTRYIAPARSTEMNPAFLTKWVDVNNKPVEDYLAFAQAVLSIPNAHKMVTQFSVMNAEQEKVMLLRPYQIHAIEAVKQAMREGKSGHVWHTTGSGKTITSYKVARNLLSIPKLDKTVFMVDRNDLDHQTMKWFKAYAEHDVIDVQDTDNVNGLIDTLLSPKRTVIVTTVQKMQHLIKRLSKEDLSDRRERDKDRLRALTLAFVVDECHRAVTAETQNSIAKFFGHSLWYGFTGTPIFSENQRTAKGDLARTTEEQYGPCLHNYTVKEAIHDKTVLGFQVEYKSTLDEDGVYQLLENHSKLESDDIDALSEYEREEYFPKHTYLTENHMLRVVESIVNRSRHKLGLTNGVGQTYTGILTTTSINQAIKYYELFRQLETDDAKVQISERVKKSVIDFPKVAITYSIQENADVSIVTQEAMKQALGDYNDRFTESFTLETLSAYNRNLNDRLARSSGKYQRRSEQLDLVIVVDRLLTGFDAPYVSTLFVDRKPMPPHDLIQAFSRTNRILDERKRYGQIVTFQHPEHYKVAVDEALSLYSKGGKGDVLAPTYTVASKRFTLAHSNLLNQATDLLAVSDYSLAKKRQFVKAFQQFDRAFSDLHVYSEFQELVEQNGNYLKDTYRITDELFESYVGVYRNTLEELRTTKDANEIMDIDIDYVLESRQTDEIDYTYILQLMQSVIPVDDSQEGDALSDQDREEIDAYISDLYQNNPALAGLMVEIWKDLDASPGEYTGANVATLVETRISERSDLRVHELAEKWNVDPDTISYVLHYYRVGHDTQIGENELRKEVRINYDEAHEYPVRKPINLPKINLPKAAVNDIYDVFTSELIPLIRKN